MSEEKKTESEIMEKHVKDLLDDPPHLLKNFHYEDVLAFLNLGKKLIYPKGVVIIKPDEVVNSAYLVAAGEVSIWKENIKIETLGNRNFLGETFLYSKNNRIAKVLCEKDCTLLKFDRFTTLDYFSKRPDKLFNIFTKNIIEIQQEKISRMNYQLFALKKKIIDDKK